MVRPSPIRRATGAGYRALGRTARRVLNALGRGTTSSAARTGSLERAGEFSLLLHPDHSISARDKTASHVERACRVIGGTPAAQLLRGDSINTSPIDLTSEHVLRIAATATAPKTRASLIIEYALAENGEWNAFAVWTCEHGASPNSPAASAQFSLAKFGGQRCFWRIRCENAGADIAQLMICAAHRVPLLNAQSTYALRLQNELNNFSANSYTHAMYGNQVDAGGEGVARDATEQSAPQTAPSIEAIESLKVRAQERLATLKPEPGELTFGYAMRALAGMLPISPPDFGQRATAMSERQPLRVLSLCAGAARIEEQLLSNCKSPVHLTLLDASRDLGERAAARLSQNTSGLTSECLVGDINAGLPGDDNYDVIMCVSALHHVVDLEAVLAQSNERLVEGGEFWSIGEQIGRNGNRLWPEAYAAANEAFSKLPPHLRINSSSGTADAVLSDADFSTGCFEGIRSEELERMLEAYFVPVHVYKRNAFLWRLVDLAYADNYDLTNSDHRTHLHQLVTAEAVHWATGGRATELHGVYRKKTLVPIA
jgi:SAM-dependent methyltransferase